MPSQCLTFRTKGTPDKVRVRSRPSSLVAMPPTFDSPNPAVSVSVKDILRDNSGCFLLPPPITVSKAKGRLVRPVQLSSVLLWVRVSCLMFQAFHIDTVLILPLPHLSLQKLSLSHLSLQQLSLPHLSLPHLSLQQLSLPHLSL